MIYEPKCAFVLYDLHWSLGMENNRSSFCIIDEEVLPLHLHLTCK